MSWFFVATCRNGDVYEERREGIAAGLPISCGKLFPQMTVAEVKCLLPRWQRLDELLPWSRVFHGDLLSPS